MPENICSAENCTRSATARGFCPRHYLRWWRENQGLIQPPTREERFWAKVDRRGDVECWPWLAASVKSGHGRFWTGGTYAVPAHRFAYELLVGPIPEDLTIDHLCRNPPCVNPGHMEPVTREENSRREAAARFKA